MSETLIRSIEYRESVASTNDVAKELTDGELGYTPVLVVTSHQTGGRGQLDKHWWSGQGSLTFSVLIAGNSIAHPELLALAAANSTACGISDVASDLEPKIKWPNDIFLNGKKVAGILIESVVRNNERFFVVGIGVNSNCKMADSPGTIRQTATSISDIGEKPVDQNQLLIAVLNNLENGLNALKHSPENLIKSCETRSVFSDQSFLRVCKPDGNVASGWYVGFGGCGELVLSSGSKNEVIVSGSIEDITDSRGNPDNMESRD